MRPERESTPMHPAWRAASGVALCTLVILAVFLVTSLVAAGPKLLQPHFVLWLLSLLLGVWAGSAVYFHLTLRCLDGTQPKEGVRTGEQPCCRPSVATPAGR